jgi:hypothetical protein
MAHFALIDENNVVQQVIVADQEFINSGAVGDPASWIQTSYNTRSSRHELGGVPLRKNFASIGYIYHPAQDFFSPPAPGEGFTLDLETAQWVCNVSAPDTKGIDTQYVWDQETQTYIGFEKPPAE